MSAKRVLEQSEGQFQTFLDELKNGTTNYRTITSLNEQVTQEYRGRCVLELLQNAHDALKDAPVHDERRVAFYFRSTPTPRLLVANSGVPFGCGSFSSTNL